MTKGDALDTIWMRCRHNDKTFEAYCVLKRELGLNELDGGDRVKTELSQELNELEQKYCDRNICLSNEYNGISCDECEVMKSQEPCEDCIRRSDIGLTDFEIVMCNGDYKEALTMLLDKIEKAHSVTPAEKVGHWEWVQYDGNPNIGNWHCSECRSVVIECANKEEKGGIPLYRYCPQCGAKMEVTDEID